MASKARREIYREGEIGIYHSWSRCVQRAWLFGVDPYTGEDFSYRRPIVEDLIDYQADVFAVDLANYTVMSNHMHLILRTRPDLVETWDDEKVALKWKRAWPDWDGTRWNRVPTDQEVRELLANPRKLAFARKALSSLSWYMARVKETLAKLFNGQMETDGHFWAERFGSREITNEQALLACMLYVDLNQMKAGLATSLEGSECSGIAARLKAAREPEVAASLKKFHKSGDGEYELSAEQMDSLFAHMMLSPIRVEGPTMTETVLDASRENKARADAAWGSEPGAGTADAVRDGNNPGVAEAARTADSKKGGQAPGAAEVTRGDAPQETDNHSIYRRHCGEGLEGRRRRASDNPILPMPFSQYREIAEWMAEQTQKAMSQPASVPDWMVQYLQRHGTDPDNWLSAVDEFHDWFGWAVGSSEGLQELLERTGNSWIKGMRNCRATFG